MFYRSLGGKRSRAFTFALVLTTSLWTSPWAAGAENAPQAPVDVLLDGHRVATIYAYRGDFSPSERAAIDMRRLISYAANSKMRLDQIKTIDRSNVTEIFISDHLILTITEQDAALAHRSRSQLASEDARKIRDAISEYRRVRNWRTWLLASVYSVLATAVFTLLVWAIIKVRRELKWRTSRWVAGGDHSVRWHRTELLSQKRIAQIVLVLLTALSWIAYFAVFEIYVTVVLGFFPWTSGWAATLTSWVLTPLGFLWTQFFQILPNLFFIAVVAVVIFYLIRLNDFIFTEIAEGRISVSSFYPDWAGPTARLIRILLIFLGLVIAYPYMPGHNSPAFQALSIFAGLLFSIGSSSAVANAVAGTILVYMRPFQIGERVQIGDTIGDIVEKNLLVTRIKTIKNVIVTVPNANVMSSPIFNYSTAAQQNALILHTSVTIGYDAPWRKIHELLIQAALRTPDVLQEPKPFVLQTALDDFYVAYEINAYTSVANQMPFIYSDLHANIQDEFNKAGMEIMSPHYTSARDGNTIAIPEEARPRGYEAPGFRIAGLDFRKERRTFQSAEVPGECGGS